MNQLAEVAPRLTFGYAAEELAAAPDFAIERLLEEGDGADLRRLMAATTEADLGAWLEQRGERRLSRRSHAFWHLLLRRRLGPRRRTIAEQLWPL